MRSCTVFQPATLTGAGFGGKTSHMQTITSTTGQQITTTQAAVAEIQADFNRGDVIACFIQDATGATHYIVLSDFFNA